jgi:hypothetical protein
MAKAEIDPVVIAEPVSANQKRRLRSGREQQALS